MEIYQQKKITSLEDLDHLDWIFIPEVFFLFALTFVLIGTEELVAKTSRKFEIAYFKIGCSTAGEDFWEIQVLEFYM